MAKTKESETPILDPKELDAAEQEAVQSSTIYEHKFGKPFNYNGKSFDSLTFDFESLTGKDSLAIEDELAAQGKIVVVPQFSAQYLVRLAAKACTEKIGVDALEQMALGDYNRIRSAARSFLLKSEL